MRLIWPWQDRQRRFCWLKASTFALIFFPAVRFTYQVVTGQYGPIGMAYGGLTYWSGVWATVILLLALAVTPALTQMSPKALVYYRKAELALRRGDITSAMMQIKMSIAADPNSKFLRAALQEIQSELGKKA